MTPNEYLDRLLEAQTLGEDGPELLALRTERERIQAALRAAFGSAPTIRYGGSKVKGTMILLSYDLDILCYFPCEEANSLEDLYDAAGRALEAAGYAVERKRSALRVRSARGLDFHVDVVPGRYFDETRTDVYLHQSDGNKQRLKTNPITHVEYVKSSGCIPEIRLGKIWREHQRLNAKTFVLELAIIEALHGTRGTLAERTKTLFCTFRDAIDRLAIIDPANSNNDLGPLFNSTIRAELADAARRALMAIESNDWERVFGPIGSTSERATARAQAVSRAAALAAPIKPWATRA